MTGNILVSWILVYTELLTTPTVTKVLEYVVIIRSNIFNLVQPLTAL